MPVVEKNGLMKYKDKSGNTYILYPVTNTDNVDGLDEVVDEAKKLDTAVAATSTDGVAYTATVPGITALTAGDSFIMIPDKLSTSRSTTLNVNNLGAKYLRVRVSGYSGTTSAAQTTNWLAPNVPVRVTYEGKWWVADVVLPSAQQLYGNVQAEQVDYSNTNSGMMATNVQKAIDELANGKTSTKVMTTAEYNALTEKNENTLYMLSDAEDTDNAVRYIENTVSISLPTKAYWSSVCYGNGKFVASSDSDAAYSTDGVNWTQTTMPASVSWDSVCYGNGKFVAVAYGSSSNNSTVAAYSTDGITWTQTTLPTGTRYWTYVFYGDGKFVALASNYSAVAAYSTDGINWTQTTLPADVSWYSGCYGNGKFVAVSSDVIAYSTDGINWTQATIPTGVSGLNLACYGNGTFVAIRNYNSNIAVYSTDGINWTQTTLPATANWSSVCYGNGKFVAVTTTNNNVVACSTDGISWTTEGTIGTIQNSSGEDISEDVKEAIGAATETYVNDAIQAAIQNTWEASY